MSNLLKAIKTIIDNPIIKVKDYYTGRNRANSVGEALENYVKDIFANSFELSESERMEKLTNTFSYLGNQNNPHDIIFFIGDSLKTKKVQSGNSDLALNSSFPKAQLFADDLLLKDEARNGENWDIKDIIYIIGHTSDSDIKHLWFIYGDCFAARKEVYERIKATITDGIKSIPDVEFAKTNELGRVNRVDPLGITNLRIRGMWTLQNPSKIFSYLDCIDNTAKFQINCILKSEKFNSFPLVDRDNLINLEKENYLMKDIKIKNPNNPAQLLDCKLITFKIS